MCDGVHGAPACGPVCYLLTVCSLPCTRVQLLWVFAEVFLYLGFLIFSGGWARLSCPGCIWRVLGLALGGHCAGAITACGLMVRLVLARPLVCRGLGWPYPESGDFCGELPELCLYHVLFHLSFLLCYEVILDLSDIHCLHCLGEGRPVHDGASVQAILDGDGQVVHYLGDIFDSRLQLACFRFGQYLVGPYYMRMFHPAFGWGCLADVLGLELVCHEVDCSVHRRHGMGHSGCPFLDKRSLECVPVGLCHHWELLVPLIHW
jgi:hypothetical protein